MTGAGKTYTMFGDINNTNGGPEAEPGIITLTIKDLFRSFESEKNQEHEFVVKLSYFEIYNEHTRDLLSISSENLMIVEDPQKGVVVPNLSEYKISSLNEVIELIVSGNSRRIMASTNANQFSSRSHAIIQIIVEKRPRAKDIIDTFTQSKLSLVDLAGSERAATSENQGLRQREGANINRSLLALGNCINILSDTNKKGAFVPYRDSKLTRLLKDSLGGNTKTIMLACVSPSYLAYEEIINTLKYANRARNIKRKITKNIKEVELHISQYREIVESLKREIEILRSQLHEKEKNPNALSSAVDSFGANSSSATKNILPNNIIPVSEYNIRENANNDNMLNLPAPQEINGLDEISHRLFTNLEENWEITQSLNELKDLRIQNEINLKEKLSQLEGLTNEPESQKLIDEIQQLKEVMLSNEKIYYEVQQNLARNNDDKATIQENVKDVACSSYDSNKLAQNCRALNMEKNELYSINQEIKNEALCLAKQKEEKYNKILKLEREMQLMKQKLVEKDKLIARNQQTIKTLVLSFFIIIKFTFIIIEYT